MTLKRWRSGAVFSLQYVQYPITIAGFCCISRCLRSDTLKKVSHKRSYLSGCSNGKVSFTQKSSYTASDAQRFYSRYRFQSTLPEQAEIASATCRFLARECKKLPAKAAEASLPPLQYVARNLESSQRRSIPKVNSLSKVLSDCREVMRSRSAHR